MVHTEAENGLLASSTQSRRDNMLALSKSEHKALHYRKGPTQGLFIPEQIKYNKAVENAKADKQHTIPSEQYTGPSAQHTVPLEQYTGTSAQHTGPSVLSWFATIMCMTLPVIGAIYLLILCFSKAQPEKRNFARAWILGRIIFFICGLALLSIILYFGVDLADKLLAYMDKL